MDNKRVLRTAIMPVALAASLAGNAATLAMPKAEAAVEIEDETQYVDICITQAQAAAIGGELVPDACVEFAKRPGLDSAQCGSPNFKSAWVRRVAVDECSDGFKSRTRGTFTGTVTYD